MNKFLCPNCGKASYTADTSQAQRCPYCIEKHIIISHEFMELLRSYTAGDLKLLINRRRKVERRTVSILVEKERRVFDRRKNGGTPIGCLMIKHPS